MPDVGNLNIEITSNASEASKGLYNVADALSRIKAAVPNNGIGLSKVATELNKFAKQINQAKATNAVLQNIANFGKGLKDMTSAIKATTNETFKTDNIKAAIGSIKDAIGDGIKLGQSGTQLKNLREALGGEWNTENAKSAGEALKYIAEGAKSLTGTNLGTIAKNVSAVAKALDEYATAAEHMIGAVGQKSGENTALMEQLAASAQKQKEWFEGGAFASGGKMPLNLQFWGGKGSKKSEGQLGMDLDGLLQKTTETTQQITDEYKQMTGTVERTPLDFSKFMQAQIPLSALGSKIDEVSQQWQRYGGMVKETFDIVQKMAGTAPIDKVRDAEEAVKQQVQETNQALVEQINLNKQVYPSYEDQNQELLEKNYGAFREAYLSGEGDWKQIAENKYGFTQRAFEEGETYAEALKITMEEVNSYVDAFIEKMNTPEGTLLRDAIDQAMTAKLALKDASESASILKNAPEIQSVSDGMQQVQSTSQSMNTAFEQTKTTTRVLTESMEDLDKELKQKKSDLNGVSDSARDLSKRLSDLMLGSNGLGGSFKRLFPTISGLVKRFSSMLKMRAIRYVIREIASGFSEGMENLYNYSKIVGTELAPAMDEAATSLQQMKNSIAAAVAPAIQALIPVLQTVVNWFITLVNYANQFIALMTGQSSWTRALPEAAEAFDDQKKKAKGASKAMKDLLADWDELNIIQSQNSGGSGANGKHTEEEYRNMFETVEEFDQKIKDIVQTIRDNLDTILRYAKKIGLLIGAWKVSSAFKGVLGTLAGLAGTLITLDLVFEVSQKFMNKYLETGEKGWLILDLLTPMVGGVIAKALLKKTMLGGVADYAIPLSFAISAAADIKALVEHTDVSALSEKGLYASFTAAAKGAIAGGYLAYLVGRSLGAALAGGTVGFIGTFGIAVSLKADAEVVADGITQENIKDKLVGISALGIAGAITGAAAGGGATGAVGMAMLFGGAAIATFGVAVGIHAINEVVDGSAITAEVVKDNFISGGLVGAGLAMVGGVLMGTAGAVAGATAGALTVGALFLIEAIIGKQPAKIKWGNYNATKNEIEAFIRDELYNNPPQVTIDLIDATIAPIDDLKTDLTNKLTTMIGTIYGLSVGVLTKPEDLLTQINGLVDSYTETTMQQQKVIDLAFNLVPTTGKNGEKTGEGDAIAKRSSERTTELNGLMEQLGKDLADAYTKAYDARMKGNLDAEAEETVKKISDMMNAVANAVATGQAKAKAGNAVQMQLQNLTKESLDELLDSYKAQQEQLVEEMLKIREDAAEGLLAQKYAYEELAKYALEQAGGDVTDKTYLDYLAKAKKANDDYLAALATMQDDAKAAAENLLDPETKKKLQEAVLGFFDRDITLDRFVEDKGGELSESFNQIIEQWTGEANNLKGNNAKQNIYSLLTQFIQASFTGEDKTTVKKAIDAGVVKFSDFLNEEMVDKLADTLGIKGEDRKVWDNYIVDLLGLKKKKPHVMVTPEVEVDKPEVEISNEFIQGASKVGHAVNDALEQTRQNIIIANEAIEDDATFEMPVTAVLDKDETEKAVEDAMPDSVKVNIEPVFGNKSAQEQILDALGLGSINLNNRKVLHNEDGTISTDRSFSFWDDKEKKEILIPQVVDGVLLSIEEAKKHYYETGEHFGKFNTYQEADAYADDLHNRNEFFYGIKEDIESAMKDGLVDATERIGMYEEWGKFAEKLGLDKTFGYDFVDGMLEYLKTNSDGTSGRGVPAKVAQMGAAGIVGGNRTMSDVGWGNGSTNEPQPVEIDFTGMTASVQKGSQEANRDVVDGLAAVVLGLQRLLGKEWSVNISPSTALGRTVGRSNSDLEAVTGYYNGGGN